MGRRAGGASFDLDARWGRQHLVEEHERVGVGVANFLNGGIFYYYGQLLEVTDEYAKIRMDIGYKQIRLDEIIEIKRARR